MIKEIAFIIYAVKDFARAREFYEKKLGLKIGEAFGDGWIEYDIARELHSGSRTIFQAAVRRNRSRSKWTISMRKSSD